MPRKCTTVVHRGYNRNMRATTSTKQTRFRSIRQSVTIPGPLAAEIRRVAKEHRLTVSRALVTLAEQGVRAEKEARANLRASYRRFAAEKNPSKKEAAGKELIRAIFGDDALAEDPLL